MKMRMRMMYKEEEKKTILEDIKGGKEIFTKQMALEKIYIYSWLVADWFQNVDWKLCGKCEAKHRDKFNSNLLELNQKKKKSKT